MTSSPAGSGSGCGPTTGTGSILAGRTTIYRLSTNLSKEEKRCCRMHDAILVTGANGFIGTHLVAALKSAGYVVYTHTHHGGDIAHCPLAFDGVAHVFHLAGKTYVPDSWESPLGFYHANVLGTVNVLEFCRRQHASITFISSYVYGKPDSLPIAEHHPLRPSNTYSH